jgi:hypothetical protein
MTKRYRRILRSRTSRRELARRRGLEVGMTIMRSAGAVENKDGTWSLPVKEGNSVWRIN